MQLTVKNLRPAGHDKSGKPRPDQWLSDGHRYVWYRTERALIH
jgi:hypothetical protein